MTDRPGIAGDNVELGLARASLIAKSDGLWSVIDAAQYASLILQDPAAGDGGSEIDDFVQAFSALIETWNAADLRNKSPLIATVLARTDALADAGIFVHWGVTHRRVTEEEDCEPALLPVAVVWLDRSDVAHLTIELPESLPLGVDDDQDDDEDGDESDGDGEDGGDDGGEDDGEAGW
jgi:hypothetical protein